MVLALRSGWLDFENGLGGRGSHCLCLAGPALQGRLDPDPDGPHPPLSGGPRGTEQRPSSCGPGTVAGGLQLPPTLTRSDWRIR
jgi:hypothetical protein